MNAVSVALTDSPIAPSFAPADPHAVLEDVPAAEIRFGLVVAGLFFVLFLGWAAFARLDAAAYGGGRVIVSGQRQAVQHRDGGVVGEILVGEGQRVRGGQVLMRLAAAEVLASERTLSLQAIDLLAQRARLKAEQSGARTITPPPEFAGLAGADLLEARRAMQMQSAQFHARASLLATQQGVLGEDTSRVREQRLGNERQLQAIREQERLVGEEIESLRPLAEKGIVSESDMRAVERTRADLAGRRGQLEAAISEASSASSQSRLKVAENRETLQEKVAAELRDVDYALNDVAPKLRAAKDQLARTEVRAPIGGTIVGLTVFNAGGVIAPGQKLMEIVPDNPSLLVEVRFSPNDIDDLRLGQQATVRFTGLSNRSLPRLLGRLQRVSADAFTDERTGTSYFTGDVAVPASQVQLIKDELGTGFTLKPGMPVEVLVPLRKRTALEYMFEPLTQSFWKSFREH